MRQSVLVRPRTSKVWKVPMLTVGPNDVLIRVKVCGICSSELHGPWVNAPSFPWRMGHEIAGDVAEVGSQVRDLRPGMAVTGLVSQGLADYAVAPDNQVTPIPEGIPYEAALGEPLSCIISAARRTDVQLGDTVAIVGLGFMGLLMLQSIRLKGAAKVITIDVRKEVLEMARTLGADEVLTPKDVPDYLKLTTGQDLYKGFGVDVAIEASGTQAALTLAGEMVRAHGVLSIVGYHQVGPRSVDMELWNWKALSVVNAHERRVDFQMDCMKRGLKLLETHKIEMKPLITHKYSLDQVDQAFLDLEKKPPGFIKAIIALDKE